MATKSELAAAYGAATYRVFLPGGVRDLHIAAPAPSLAAWLADNGVDRWAILTAWNPGSRPLPESDNRQRQAALEVALLERGFEPYAGENLAAAGDWPAEESCFVAGLGEAEAVALGRQFGQNAVVVGAADGTPRLVWTDGEHD